MIFRIQTAVYDTCINVVHPGGEMLATKSCRRLPFHGRRQYW